MGTEIYYFSGTGNSLHAAKELQKRLPEATLIPLLKYLDRAVITTTSETVGLVFPIYLMNMPAVVKKLLQKLDLSSATYIFALSTRGGTPVLADWHLQNILKEKGKRLNAYFTLNMFWTSPVGLMPVYIPGMTNYPGSAEKLTELEAAAQRKLDMMQRVIINQEPNPADDFPSSLALALKRGMATLMKAAEKSNEQRVIPYYADDHCTSCGLCEQVCLSTKIKMEAGKPVWQEDVQCYFCYACFNHCPVQAILVKNLYTKREGRYLPPNITAQDIAGQKGAAYERNSSNSHFERTF